MMSLVSVVVIGRNEGARLSRCLDSIAAAGITDPSRVIYVDSCSSDDSVARATAFGAAVVTVNPARPCAAIGRNAGWRRAGTPFVLFLDGDTVLAPGFLEAGLEALTNRRVAVAWGHRREINGGASIYTRVLDRGWIYAPGPSDFCGSDALMRRSALAAVGGFDEGLIAGEEPELCRRLRALELQILHLDQPMTGHDLAITRPSQYLRRAVRAGYAYAEVSSRFSHTDDPFWSRDAAHNLTFGGGLLGLIAAAITMTIAAGSALPLAGLLAVLLLLSLRAARRARWKGADRPTLLAYGVHSILQHLPILFGQLAYYRDRSPGRQRGLIDYKERRASG
jgi:glycosyltransferase involved in cell wall biosynthesis